MGYRINHVNKTTGVTYVYESTSYWDKAKKQSRNKQVCIGRLDPINEAFIPSKRLSPEQAAVRDPVVTASAEIVGPSLILDAIGDRLGIKILLKSCFPKEHEWILTMVYYLACQGGPLGCCGLWCKNHATAKEILSSQRISEILRSISTDEKQTFLSRWMKKIIEDDYLCYDITSISSYSELNEYIKFGYNRDGEKLPQLNLAILFGQKGRLPVYYHRLPGNITDVTTLHNLLKTIKILEMKTLHYVMDKGFYSWKNVDELVQSRDKFVLSVPIKTKWVQHAIDDIAGVIQGPDGYRKIDGEILYVHSRLYPWGKRRCYLHLYYLISRELCN
jgi:hypothetical protein